jgi:hypothetical protein
MMRASRIRRLRDQKTYARNTALAQKKMKGMGVEPKTVASQITQAPAEMPAEEAMPEMMTEEQPMGLMARRA